MTLREVRNPDVLKAFGLRLRRLRDERNISQQALADMADISKLTVQRIELGRASVGLDILISIANTLQLPLQEFFRIE
ncbi:MAG: XRE family transcriptional regulator [Hymenobacter sp.]|nr:MAG: XRE family transcriptional regulator [Hymenobacter sp.]